MEPLLHSAGRRLGATHPDLGQQQTSRPAREGRFGVCADRRGENGSVDCADVAATHRVGAAQASPCDDIWSTAGGPRRVASVAWSMGARRWLPCGSRPSHPSTSAGARTSRATTGHRSLGTS